MKLSELKNNEKGVITKVLGRGAFRKRIIEMGFINGKEVKVLKNAPLKDPIEYKLMDYNVSLRRSEAELIEVITPEINIPCNKPFPKGKGHGHGRRRQFKKFSDSITVNDLKKTATDKAREINVALVGNPNSGKTTLFNFASGSRAKVGNYGGVTVEAKKSVFRQNGYKFNIVDLPGTYSITAYTPEEKFVRDYIFNDAPDVVINVIDSSNLERNLYLTTQLIDMDIKVVVALNMYDELEKKSDIFDYENLGKLIGIPFVPTVSPSGKGIDKLFEKVIDVYEDRDETLRHIHINYGHDIENAIKSIQDKINIEENYSLTDRISSRFLAIKLLERDSQSEERIFEHCKNNLEILLEAKNQVEALEEHLKDDSETLITDAKYGFIAGALRETFSQAARPPVTLSEKIDRVITHKIFGFPIFLTFMWLTFQLTFSLGEYPMNWIDSFIGTISDYISHTMPPGLLKELLNDGIIAGVGGVIIFLPNILILFFMISLMEDTGYMARAAFIMDKLMHKMGLHGKSFIPLIMGFGCNVPAIMATRTLDSKNDRLLTMLILPFMSCSARLPVYVLLISAFFTLNPGSILFIIYILGITLAIISAKVLKKIFFKSYDIPFVMELPPYRVPHIKTTLLHMWEKGIEYLRKIGGVILVASIIIWALGKLPLDINFSKDYDSEIAAIEKHYLDLKGSIPANDEKKLESINREKESALAEITIEKDAERLEKSYIGQIGYAVEPIIRPLGFDWKIGVSIVTGLAAKEIVVSTMGVLYHAGPGADETSSSLISRLQEQVYTSGPMKGEKVITPLVAFCLILFILIYFPCVATLATIKKESGKWKWAIFSASYNTILAWILTFIVFQVGSKIFLLG